MSKLICFDADLTIFEEHVHSILDKLKYTDKSAVENFELLKNQFHIKNKVALKNFIKDAISEGHKIAIVSFTSFPKFINKFLQEELDLREDLDIEIPVFSGSSTHKRKYGKNLLIRKAMTYFELNIFPQDVLLIDDDYENTTKAEKQGYIAISVDKNPEATPEYLDQAREFLDMAYYDVEMSESQENIPSIVPEDTIKTFHSAILNEQNPFDTPSHDLERRPNVRRALTFI